MSVNTISLDKDVINAKIISGTQFKIDNVLIKAWDKDNDADELKFLCEITLDKYSYIGILNADLERDMLGINKYPNGDVHFGKWKNDKKHKNGIYIYSPIIEKGIVYNEIYQGLFNDDIKTNNGIYFWKCDDIKGNNLWFEVYIGEMEKDSYKRGVYLYQTDGYHYAYFGSIDSSGKKNDKQGYFYFQNDNKVLIGEVKENKLISGYAIYFDGSEVLFKKFTCEENKIIFSQCDVIEDIRRRACAFRAILYEKNYFEDIRSHFNKVIKHTNSLYINSFDEDSYFKQIDLLASHNQYYSLYTELVGLK